MIPSWDQTNASQGGGAIWELWIFFLVLITLKEFGITFELGEKKAEGRSYHSLKLSERVLWQGGDQSVLSSNKWQDKRE